MATAHLCLMFLSTVSAQSLYDVFYLIDDESFRNHYYRYHLVFYAERASALGTCKVNVVEMMVMVLTTAHTVFRLSQSIINLMQQFVLCK